MTNHFEDTTFTNGMEVILRKFGNDKNRLLLSMKRFEEDSADYQTYDCALCYLLYKALKLTNNKNIKELGEQLNIRIQNNIEKMQVINVANV